MARKARGGSTNKGEDVHSCLVTIGVDLGVLAACTSLDDEWKAIKKQYFKIILVQHPDKGGDPAIFRDIQTAFEVLRELYEKQSIKSFAASSTQATASAYAHAREGFQGTATPSWEYYQTAAEEEVPEYRVELAKSNRSACTQSTKIGKKCGDDVMIEKGAVRIGVLNKESGTYTFWVHLRCWRVPQKVWMGLPDPAVVSDPKRFEAALVGMSEVLLSGVGELPPSSRAEFVLYAMDQTNWAKWKPGKPAVADGAPAAKKDKKDTKTAAGAKQGKGGSAKAAGKAGKASAAEAEADDMEEEEDVACEVCGSPSTPPEMLLCDKCDKGYHTDCLVPKLKAVPAGDWFCPKCEARPGKAKAGGGGQTDAKPKVDTKQKGPASGGAALVPAAAPASASAALVPLPEQHWSKGAGGAFTMPVPGVDAPRGTLNGMTVVLTGVFPEVGGGAGLNLGKDRTKAMIERFGGKVTGSVSGRTDVLLVGAEPGFSKVSQARSRPKIRLMSIPDMRDALVAGKLDLVRNTRQLFTCNTCCGRNDDLKG
uniref:Uncharacterized protein n=1 Tax=Pyramimonas obovata TaxID=1411642 RepID=A0A7S0N4Q4_9CHLO|mmetsp:Transcript_19992/g.43746  ORF Transcript_19992/g.43746 Transcript_19992/m.43746 type:complete len:538 (+) Transcript_19992:87-1700(+)